MTEKLIPFYYDSLKIKYLLFRIAPRILVAFITIRFTEHIVSRI